VICGLEVLGFSGLTYHTARRFGCPIFLKILVDTRQKEPLGLETVQGLKAERGSSWPGDCTVLNALIFYLIFYAFLKF
jgi:hypothetical protein